MGHIGDVLNDMLAKAISKSGKHFSLADFQNPKEGPIIGHKMVHSNDGNLVLVGGYENSTGTWSNVVRRLDCTTLKKGFIPDCRWMDMYDGMLDIGRQDHVAMMLHHNFCNFI